MSARVITTSANLYASPDKNASLETQLLFGETFLIEQQEKGWVKGTSQTDNYPGYLKASQLEKIGRGRVARGPALRSRAVRDSATHIVSAARTCFYPAPDVKTPPLMTLPCGAQLNVEQEDSVFVRTASGFVPTKHVMPLNDRIGDFVEAALALVGAPYIWGGRDSTQGIDCSALCQLALSLVGIAAPRNSGEQEAELGVAVPPNAPLQRGDFVFWHAHVGILVDEATLLHANAFHMAAATEPLHTACARIEPSVGKVRVIKRL